MTECRQTLTIEVGTANSKVKSAEHANTGAHQPMSESFDHQWGRAFSSPSSRRRRPAEGSVQESAGWLQTCSPLHQKAGERKRLSLTIICSHGHWVVDELEENTRFSVNSNVKTHTAWTSCVQFSTRKIGFFEVHFLFLVWRLPDCPPLWLRGGGVGKQCAHNEWHLATSIRQVKLNKLSVSCCFLLVGHGTNTIRSSFPFRQLFVRVCNVLYVFVQPLRQLSGCSRGMALGAGRELSWLDTPWVLGTSKTEWWQHMWDQKLELLTKVVMMMMMCRSSGF